MVKNEIEWQKATFEWGDNIAEMAYFREFLLFQSRHLSCIVCVNYENSLKL